MSRIPRLIAAVDVWRSFQLGSEEINALRGVNLEVRPGQFLAVVGRSGSGKTSLLNIMAGLDKPSSGQVFSLLPLSRSHALPAIRNHMAWKEWTAMSGGSESWSRRAYLRSALPSVNVPHLPPAKPERPTRAPKTRPRKIPLENA